MAGNTRLDPEGRVIMISGANRGIGAAIARRLYADGYSLSLGVRDPAAAEPVAGDWEAARTLVTAFDAREAAAPARWVEATVARFGRLDGVVNNAGVARGFDFEAADEAVLDEMLEVNAKAPFRLIRASRPHLRAAGNGRIVVVTSLAGVRYKWGSVGYAMSKHAAAALTNAARVRLWEDGIRVTAVAPGPVLTDMGRGLDFPHEEMTSPDSIAEMVSALLALPNTASVALLPINAVAEPLL